MTAQSNTTTPNKNSLVQIVIWCIVSAIFFPGLTLLLAGDWGWLEGWLFGLWFDAMILSNVLYMYLRDPALLAERSKRPGSDNQKRWDTVLLSLVYFVALVWLIIMPLDAKRFMWSAPFAVWIKVIGGVMLLPALFLIFRATADNTFLSTRVRIQTDRKQRVISTGVYGFVRHPLYLGCTLMIVGAPLLLGSVAGLIIGLIGLAMVIYRIIGEEKMLVNELEGYDEYKTKVKYRLVPLVW
jgi:protein-S-isoprenylcysteine O-methyltransferase Ste14